MTTRKITQSLFWQIGIPLLLAFVTLGLAGVLFFYLSIERLMQSQLHQTAEIAAHSVQYSVESSIRQNAIQRYVASLGAEPEINTIFVAAGSPLRIIASTSMSTINSKIDSESHIEMQLNINAALTQNKPIAKFKTNQREIYLYILPCTLTNIKEFDKQQFRGVIYLEVSTENYRRALQKLSMQVNGLFIVILISLTIILAVILRTKIILPQQNIIDLLTRRKQGEKAFCTKNPDNEVGEISHAINELLAHGDQLESLKSQFISTVSHELRTPLTSIRGSLGLLKQFDIIGRTEGKDKILDIALRNSEQLTSLINDLLDLEKLSDSNLKLDRKHCNLIKITEDAIQSMQGYALQHQVKILLHLAADYLPVLVDEHRIHQVFANLLSNAIKFSKTDGTVVVLVTTKSGTARVSIIDQGKGIPENFQNKIFSRFSQADSSDSREKGGTGLGLSIAKSIIELHGGNIGFESTQGLGTRFYFSLPISPSPGMNDSLKTSEQAHEISAKKAGIYLGDQ